MAHDLPRPDFQKPLRSYFLDSIAGDQTIFDRFRQTGIYLVDFSLKRATSSYVMEKLGFSGSEFDVSDFESRIHPHDKALYRSLWNRVFEGRGDEFSAEYRFRDVAGNWHWIHSRGTVLTRTDSGEVALFAGVDTEIGSRKEAEQLLREQLEEEERRFSLSETLRTAGMAASTSADSGKTIDIILEQARQFIEFDAASLRSVRKKGNELILRYPEDGPPLPQHGAESLISEVIKDKTPRIDNVGGEGGTYKSWMGIPLILRRELLGVLEFWRAEADAFRGDQLWPAVAFSDTIAVALSNQRQFSSLLEEARTDLLTGLCCRRHFNERGINTLAYLRENELYGSLILLDIDRFKMFNDRYGHLLGDEVLRIVAAVFRRTLRREDLVCRFGGEEFLALLPGVPLKRGLAVAERLRISLETSRVPGIDGKVTASFGVAEFRPSTEEPLQNLIMRADLAMYKAKSSGRNRVVAADQTT